MRRHSVIRIFLSCLNDDDVAIFVGGLLCKEAYKYDRLGNFYIKDGYAASLALGIANGIENNVFIFCDDSYLVRDLSEAAQIAVSRCRNIVYVVLKSGFYQESGFQPTISNNISGLKSAMFNFGFLVHDYTLHFKMGNPKKEIKSIWSNLVGPLIIFTEVDKGINRSIEVTEMDYTLYRYRFIDFLRGAKNGI